MDVADFDGDGNPDYLLFNPEHLLYGDLVSVCGYLSRGALGPTLPSALALVGVGDFNGDGSPDYVLYKASTGQTAIGT